MFSVRAAFMAFCVSAAVSRAEVRIELVPSSPPPFYPGEFVVLHVYAHSEVTTNEYIHFEQLSFIDSDPAIQLASTFSFDLSASATPQDFILSPDLPVPSASNWREYSCQPCRLFLPALGTIHMGTVSLELPLSEGAYRVDALNADEPDEQLGAYFADDNSWWRANAGEVTGGTYDFVVQQPAIPAISEKGLVVMSIAVLIAGTCLLKARRAVVAFSATP